MSVKLAVPNLDELASRHPFALIVGEIKPAVGGDIHAVRASQSVGPRNHLALGSDLHAEAAIRHFRLMAEAEADVQRDEHVAVFIARRAVNEFVVVARQAEFIADRRELVGNVVFLRAADQRQSPAAAPDKDRCGRRHSIPALHAAREHKASK